MKQFNAPVTDLTNVTDNIFVLTFRAAELASTCQPGQFINIKVNDLVYPLLRRPFSVYMTVRDEVKIIFNVVGEGTQILSTKNKGEFIDIVGPLGHPFTTDGDYDTALLVGGGLGVAPLPAITTAIRGKKEIVTFLGSRTGSQIVDRYLENVHLATDDGTRGFHGTVVELLRNKLGTGKFRKPKIFACGPNAMLKSLSVLTRESEIQCEVSLETAMACGIGICQGCPVERVESEKKYSLVCKEGPVFDVSTICLP